jgi:hypothetical protein
MRRPNYRESDSNDEKTGDMCFVNNSTRSRSWCTSQTSKKTGIPPEFKSRKSVDPCSRTQLQSQKDRLRAAQPAAQPAGRRPDALAPWASFHPNAGAAAEPREAPHLSRPLTLYMDTYTCPLDFSVCLVQSSSR